MARSANYCIQEVMFLHVQIYISVLLTISSSAPFTSLSILLPLSQVVRRLIQAGADVNSVRDTLATPLHAAAVIGHADIIQLLLEVRGYWRTLLRCAVVVRASSLGRCVKVLLGTWIKLCVSVSFQNGSRLDATDSYQQTPLHKAAIHNQSDAINKLLDFGAKIERRDK